MQLTADQVLALAPDASSAAAGRKLASAKGWQGLGRNPAALWGECQGSALYQVRVDLSDLTAKCSCPSRKFPCKHALGLLLLAAMTPAALPEGEPPEWVSDWLNRRAATAERREEKKAQQVDTSADAEKSVSPAGTRASKGGDKRLARVRAGLDALDLWLDDLMRNGIASVETQPVAFWERQAARLVDAQAPGVAGRLRRLSAIPNASRDWPARLLDGLGRLALLTHAFRRLDGLDPALQEDVRGAIGWSLGQEEVAARGEAVSDDWLVLGQRVTTEERLRTQWTWLLGARTGRYALVLQFAHGGQPFPSMIIPGTLLAAELAFWPSAWPLRALVRERRSSPTSIGAPLPGHPSLAALLDHVATATARQPWLDRFPCAVSGVVPICGGESVWLVRDADGAALPLADGEHWRLLALSGGTPVDLAAEWDGEALLPLGVLADGTYHLLTEGR
jgi:hypothetical protein